MNENLIELEMLLQSQKLMFKELNTRMNYGAIGHLFKDGKMLCLIFGGSFHVSDFDVAINEPLLRIVELIRLEFTELSRDIHGHICPTELGFLAMRKEGN
ncbi:hypothetical protein [Flavobacterium sp.]|uniref:hypothetical protein n=1 Tax=Flavobacterium sp. TaxID=239 RepID=UPI0026063BE3|nr:hypothetical protein [Flavobacterium sp.]